MQHTHTGVRAHTPLGPCTPSAWAPLAHRSCSTPAAPLQRPCSACSAPAVPGCCAACLTVRSQAPSVPENIFSNELAEFVSLCLNKNEIKRPSANDLLKHHWLRKHPTDDMLLSASLEKMML